MMKKSFICIVFLFFVSGCKKDKLEGEIEILIGEWVWFKTVKKVSICNPPTNLIELTPSSENRTFQIKFFQKGRVEFYEDSELIEKYRVVMNGFGTPCGAEGLYYGIYLNNRVELVLDGCVWTDDTLMVVRGFPFPDPEDNCEDFTSYFVRK